MNEQELAELLGDESTWAEPPADLEDRVVRAVQAESGSASGATRTAPGRARRWLRYAAVAMAAPAFVAGLALGHGDGGTATVAPQFTGTLTGIAGASGTVELVKTQSGWRVDLDGRGLPRRADGRYYQAWLLRDGADPVPVGTFNEPGKVTLWAGVRPSDYGTLVVTTEELGDGSAGPGPVVLRASLHPIKG
ncbi:MAG: anti-sigma factor [Nocardioidaceae bacterium]|nr:anti-sigma factor [Nocardioidaceae bacterium]